MARIEQGILGPFSGKVGEVIGSSWKGIPYIKARPTQFHDAKTPKQLTHRMQLQAAHSFVRTIKPLIEIGFRNVTGTQTPYNKAVSCVLKNAVVGEYPELGIAPNKIIVSQGVLAKVDGCKASIQEDGNIIFSWEEQNSPSEDLDHIEATILAYNFAKQQGKWTSVCQSEHQGAIKISTDWQGDAIACYIFFASTTSAEVSDSEFLGTFSSKKSIT